MTEPVSKKMQAAAKAVEDLDAEIAEAVEPYRDTPLVRAISLFSEIGDQPPMRTLCAATIAAGLAGGYPRLTRAGLRMIAAHTLATAAKNFVKLRVDRTRPHAKGDGDGHRFTPGNNPAKEETSFPSGHTAGAVAVARAFSREFPEYGTAALGAAGVIALAQIPRCAHYPADVGAGAAIGLVSEAVVDGVLKLFVPPSLLPQAANASSEAS